MPNVVSPISSSETDVLDGMFVLDPIVDLARNRRLFISFLYDARRNTPESRSGAPAIKKRLIQDDARSFTFEEKRPIVGPSHLAVVGQWYPLARRRTSASSACARPAPAAASSRGRPLTSCRQRAASGRGGSTRRRRDVAISWRCVAATPRPRRGYSVDRGDAAGAAWIVRGDDERTRAR